MKRFRVAAEDGAAFGDSWCREWKAVAFESEIHLNNYNQQCCCLLQDSAGKLTKNVTLQGF